MIGRWTSCLFRQRFLHLKPVLRLCKIDVEWSSRLQEIMLNFVLVLWPWVFSSLMTDCIQVRILVLPTKLRNKRLKDEIFSHLPFVVPFDSFKGEHVL